MNYKFGFIDIILLAMFAGFIILRLRNILGRGTGHQAKPINKYFPKGMDILKDIENNEAIKTANINELLTQIRIHDNQITNNPFLSKTRLKENIYNFATILSLPGVSIINKLYISINIIRSLIILCLKYYK